MNIANTKYKTLGRISRFIHFRDTLVNTFTAMQLTVPVIICMLVLGVNGRFDLNIVLPTDIINTDISMKEPPGNYNYNKGQSIKLKGVGWGGPYKLSRHLFNTKISFFRYTCNVLSEFFLCPCQRQKLFSIEFADRYFVDGP